MHDPPSVPLFQWLARGSLKQNLPQAVRLWVWLRLLYGTPSDRLLLPDPFTYAEWRTLFFTASHPKSDAKPSAHDPRCPCRKVAAAWLFGACFTQLQAEWEQSLQSPAQRSFFQERSHQLEQDLITHDALPDAFATFLNTPLFQMTGRTLRNDLKVLADIHWLTRKGQKYYRVQNFPDRPSVTERDETPLLMPPSVDFLTQPDLAAIAHNLSQVLNGQRRFFVHVEYVVPEAQIDQVDDWQSQLRDIWSQVPIPPLELTLYSTALKQEWTGIAFPVCIYYYRRGPYLCTFGQCPDLPATLINWRNFRLDRISALRAIAWDDPRIPPVLLQHYHRHTLPTPDEIQIRMADAWGFDYYQPAQRLVLRFDPDWDERYIKNSLRHPTFQRISYDQVQHIISTQTHDRVQEQLMQIWRSRAPNDAYYQVQYRQHDPNVWQRLRAWRPHVEVLLPWDLRQRITQEVAQEWTLYHAESP
jgi:CRISPR-associated protein (TIGR03985 family)